MEEEDDGEMGTPFWVQSTTNLRRVDRFRHGVSSLIFSSGVLLFILLVTSVFFMVYVIPTTIHTAHLQFFRRSNAVMKNWDSVNLVLVLVALFFGFISRNNKNKNYNNVVDDDIQSTATDHNQHYYHHHHPQNNNSAGSNVVADKSAPNTRWYVDYSHRRDYSSSSNHNYYYGAAAANSNSPRLRRNSTSYPDLHLRQQILSSPSVDYYNVNDHRRFYDDSPIYYRRPSWKQFDTTPADNEAVISKPDDQKLEDTSYVLPPSPPPTSPPPPPPLPPWRRTTEQKVKRIYKSLPHELQTNEDVRVIDSEVTRKTSVPPPPPPPPPMQHLAEKSDGSKYKKRNAGRDQNFLTSYYQKKKKKRQRQRSIDNLDALFNQSQVPKTHTQHQSQVPKTHTQPPPPPPPPPRSSTSVFHNLFSSKKAKRRKIPSDLHPSSLPPPRQPQFNAASVSKPKPNIQTPTKYKPPIPIKIKSINYFDDNSSSGGSSPLNSIPPPPPLPPFKIAEWKHVVKGDYVSIESNPSSRSGSPDTDEADSFSPEADTTASPVSLFCPSPDVDTKADNFIARFRAGLKLEKIDSFNKKQVSRMSNLGPGSGPSQD